MVRLWVKKSLLLEHRLYNRVKIQEEKLKDNEGGRTGLTPLADPRELYINWQLAD